MQKSMTECEHPSTWSPQKLDTAYKNCPVIPIVNGKAVHDNEDSADTAVKSPSVRHLRMDRCEATQRKLILHFDARNTVFVADLFSRISVEQALNTYLAGVIWGYERDDGSFDSISEQPSLRAPFPGATSLYKLIEKRIVKVPEDRAKLRQVLGDFTQTPEGERFQHLFHKHLDLLSWAHDKDPQLTVTGLDGKLYHYLLPSFFNLLGYLTDSGRDFCIVVRTFGKDANHILKATEKFARGVHPDYPENKEIKNLIVDERVERFNRTSGDKMEYHTRDGEVLSCQRDIYEHWNQSSGVIAAVDDFVHWQNNKYHYSAAKPLWFERAPSQSQRVQHIIFDDNIRVDDDDNILNLLELPKGEVTGRSLEPEEAKHFENVLFVQADLLDSTSQSDYFIRKVRLCEENFNKMWDKL